jgi:probable F420-dependent oxidoreductase
MSHLELVHRVIDGRNGFIAAAVAAEEAGFDQFVLSEHVVLPAVVQGHPGARPGDAPTPFPFPSDEEYPEPLVALAAAAAATRRIRLSTNVLIAPLRPAALLAKQAATVAVLSGNRFDLGVGTGWQEEEFAAHDVPLAGVGSRLEDTITACRALWTGQPATVDTETVRFNDMVCSPVPTEPIPVWFGGSAGPRLASRVARLGDGWTVIGATTLDDVRDGIERLREAYVERDRDPATLAVRCSLPYQRRDDGGIDIAATVAHAEQMVSAGATHLQLSALAPGHSADDPLGGLATAASVAEALRSSS